MRDTTKLRCYLFVSLLGLWAGQFQALSYQYLILLSLLMVLFLPIKLRFWWRLVFMIFISMAYSQWRPIWADQRDTLSDWRHKIVEIHGVVDGWPENRQNSQKVIVRAQSINSSKVTGRFLLTGNTHQSWSYGQTITVTGKLSAPQSFDGFDYPGYLERFNVRHLMTHPKSIIMGDNDFWLKPAIKMRTWFEHNLNQNLPRPNRELAAGVLIGTKSVLPEPTQTYVKDAGLQHLIVVSGSNVVILIALMSWLTRPLGPFLQTFLSTLVLGLFVFITGAEPPVLRAGLFGLVIITATSLGKKIDIRNLLLLAGVLIGIGNPLIVQQDISFWLSFSATAGIILGFPIYRHYVCKNKSFEILKILFGISLTAQLAVLPVLIMSFGAFPWVGLISNLLAEPVIPLTMATSLLAGLTGILPDSLASLLSIPALICTEWLHLLAHIFGRWPRLILPDGTGLFPRFYLVLGIFLGFILKFIPGQILESSSAKP